MVKIKKSKHAPHLVDLWADAEKAREEWVTHYRTLPKFGRTSQQAYKDNGLWRRWKNREKKYNDAHRNARWQPPTP